MPSASLWTEIRWSEQRRSIDLLLQPAPQRYAADRTQTAALHPAFFDLWQIPRGTEATLEYQPFESGPPEAEESGREESDGMKPGREESRPGRHRVPVNLVAACRQELANAADLAWSNTIWLSNPSAAQLGVDFSRSRPVTLKLTAREMRFPTLPPSGSGRQVSDGALTDHPGRADQGGPPGYVNRRTPEIGDLLDQPFMANGPTRQAPRRKADAIGLAGRLGLLDQMRGAAVIGVVGSKGKGTAVLYAAATFAAAGLKVGSITGPGVTSGIERIRVNGQVIPQSDYAELGRTISHFDQPDLLRGISISGRYLLFGLSYLLEQQCQVIILEAGIGGASDELSVLPLRYLLVTQILPEHVERLGGSLEQIALDKLGCVGATTSKVFYLPQSDAVQRIVKRIAGPKAQPVPAAGVLNYERHLAVGYGRRNAVLGVKAALEILGERGAERVDQRRLEQTLRTVSLPGRLMSLTGPGGSTMLLDSAINRDGLVCAILAAKKLANRPLDNVFVSIPADKDLAGFGLELQALKNDGAVRRVVFVELGSARNLIWPRHTQAAWEWRGEDAITRSEFRGDCAAVGTALFSGAVLNELGLNAQTAFRVPPSGPAADDQQMPPTGCQTGPPVFEC
jgi:dihydrofolate synthase/folylpolyglutamate synthase